MPTMSGASSSPFDNDRAPSQPRQSLADDLRQQRQWSGSEYDNLAARRAASEAIEIGRATAEAASAQGEQLSRADDMAEEQRYMLDRAARALRGRTWGGWVANMFSSGPVRPDQQGGGGGAGGGGTGGGGVVVGDGSEFDYVDVPPLFASASRVVADYRRHAQLLLPACDSRDQRAACRVACEGLRDRARRELRALEEAGASGGGQEEEGWVWYNVLSRDKEKADEALQRADGRTGGDANEGDCGGGSVAGVAPRGAGASAPNPTATFVTTNDELARKAAVQDDHLSALSSDLDELRNIGHSLHETFNGHNELLDSLADKSDELEDQTKRIRRKADRLAESARWKKTPAKLKEIVSFRHLGTGLHLGCPEDGSSTPKLQQYHKSATVWELWTRQGDIIGLKNRHSRRWLGQSMLGYVVCSATKFGRSEEWELDEDRQSTRLLCAGANWGGGGWLEVHRADGERLSIGSYGVEAGKKAAHWKVLMDEEVQSS